MMLKADCSYLGYCSDAEGRLRLPGPSEHSILNGEQDIEHFQERDRWQHLSDLSEEEKQTCNKILLKHFASQSPATGWEIC